MGEGGGLHIGLDAKMGAGSDWNLSRVVPIGDRAAVELELKRVFAAVGAFCGKPAADIMRHPRALDFAPVHRQLFRIAQASLFKVDDRERAIGLLRKERERGKKNQTEKPAQRPINIGNWTTVG